MEYIFLFLSILISSIMGCFMNSLGYDTSNWQYWVGCGCVWASCLFGGLYGIFVREDRK